uniref:Uncharacterized protein n=1 Tax=Romanomermis culicivorax TaxID=13658 RepID=A0A915JAA0_ROMCU
MGDIPAAHSFAFGIETAPTFPFDIIVRDKAVDRSAYPNSDDDDDEFHEAVERQKSCSRGEITALISNINPQIHMDVIETDLCAHEGNMDQQIFNGNLASVEERCFEEAFVAEKIILNSVLMDPPNLQEDDEGDFFFCFPTLDAAREQANILAKKVWSASWKATHFYSLPEWLQDNDFLHAGHRPPLPSFTACFNSIFRVHTETGNIWTHMIG